MDDISKKREALMTAYKSPRGGGINKSWADKVKQMSDAQVTAVYLRMKGQGKI